MENTTPSVTNFDRDGDNFLTIAHRGASAYYPENTMAAFKAAIAMKADMMELDILLSKDGEVVVIHDETLDRTTNGRGKVSEKNLEELKKLDAGSWFNPTFSEEKIPTLHEVLELARDSIYVNIEIKTEAVTNQAAGGIEEKSLAVVKDLNMESQVMFSSFDYRAIRHLQQLEPDIAKAILYNRDEDEFTSPSALVEEYQADAFNCSYRQLTPHWLRDARQHAIPVYVYTVNKKSSMQKLIKKGVSGIFSDKPDILKKIAQSTGS